MDALLAGGARTVTLSGGEPTLLRRRLIALVARARAGGAAFVELQTNAILVDRHYAAELAAAGLGSAFVSLLSDDAALHDQLAGLPGAFPRCLAGIDALLDAGVRVTLNPVIARATQARLGAAGGLRLVPTATAWEPAGGRDVYFGAWDLGGGAEGSA